MMTVAMISGKTKTPVNEPVVLLQMHVEHRHERELRRRHEEQQRHEERLDGGGRRAGVLAVGDLVEPDLERGKHEEDQADLGVEPGARVGVLVGSAWAAWASMCSGPHLIR